MAVYTRVGADEMRSFMDGYDVGAVESFVGIADGVENTNYLLITSGERFVLTLYEKRVREEDLPFFLALMEHLAGSGIPCPVPVPARGGAALGRVAGRPAALITFLEGVSRSRIDPRHCRAVGAALAAMHRAAESFPLERENGLSLASWRRSLEGAGEAAEAFLPGLAEEARRDLERIEEAWPADLPRGTIHGDLFPDNVFFLGDEVSGLIDFYFACTDLLAYDLAVCVNAWCFEPDADFNVTKAGQLLAGYRSVRPLADGELAALPVLCSGSALRFLLTRLADWTSTPAAAMVRPKDPAEYLGRLRFHRAARGPEAYGLGGRLMAGAPVEIHTDGSCAGNPGPGGWGAVIRGADGVRELSGSDPATTNNRMELLAAAAALETLPPGTSVRLATDSRYVRDGITSWLAGWKRKGWKTAAGDPVKNRDLWERLERAAAGLRVEWRWVRGHAGDPGNERADALARAAAESARRR